MLGREHGCPAVVDNDVNIMTINPSMIVVGGGLAGLASELAYHELF